MSVVLGLFCCFFIWCIHQSFWVVMLNLSLFLLIYACFFLIWAYIGSWISLFFFCWFCNGAFFLLFCCSSDESLRFWHRDIKAVVLNIFRVVTIWKHRLCHFFIRIFLSLLSLSLSLSLSASLSVSLGLFLLPGCSFLAVEYTASSKHCCFYS